MATANRAPPVHPGPHGGNLPFRPSSGLPNSGQLDPGLPGTSHEPGPSSYPYPQHTRPLFYAPTHPPPPFLQCQWPMPVSYNPFSVFPSMGYGMVMPPFPPPLPPYMEAPAYFLPPSHIPPMEYRRMPHPQVHAPNTAYQLSNQTRRNRFPHSVPVRETVSSAVQTEPIQTGLDGHNDRFQALRSDSGHETVSNSPSPSSSSSHKTGSVEGVNFTPQRSNTNSVQGNRLHTPNPVKHGVNRKPPAETKTAPTRIRASAEKKQYHEESTGQEEVLPYGTEQSKMWSVGSADGVGHMCSSAQQEDEGVREGPPSVPDILRSWSVNGSVQQEEVQEILDNVPSQSNNHQLSDVPEEKSDEHSPVRPQDDAPTADSHDVVVLREKGNVSVWSVESLVPHVPPKDSLWWKSFVEPGVIVSTPAKKPENDIPPSSQSLKSGKSRRQSRRFSFEETDSMCDSWISFLIPNRRNKNDKDTSENEDSKHDQSIFDLSLSPTKLPQEPASEPQAPQSQNPETLIINDQQEEACRSPQQETPTLNHKEATGHPLQSEVDKKDVERGTKAIGELGNGQLCVPDAEQGIRAPSPSKGDVVDCGVQCTLTCSLDLQPCCKHCKGLESGVGPCKVPPPKNTVKSGHAPRLFMNAAEPTGHYSGKKKKRRAASWTPTLGNV